MAAKKKKALAAQVSIPWCLTCQRCPDVFLSEPGQASLASSKVGRRTQRVLNCSEAGWLFSIWKSSLARVQFSSTSDTELQGIHYTTWWTKASPYTFFGGTSIFSHPPDRRKQRKVTGAEKLIPAILKKDVLREREWLLKMPLTTFPACCPNSCLTTVLFVAHDHHENEKGREKGTLTPCANISREEHCSW